MRLGEDGVERERAAGGKCRVVGSLAEPIATPGDRVRDLPAISAKQKVRLEA